MIVSETNQDTISGSKVKQLLIQNNLDFLNSKRKDNKRSLLSSQLNETNNGRELRSSSINNLNKLNPKRMVSTPAAPEANQVISDITIIGLYDLEINWDESLFTDANGDIIHSQVTHDFTGSWFTVDDSDARVHGTTTNTDLGSFTVTLRLYDDTGEENFYNVNVVIVENLAPTFATYLHQFNAYFLNNFEVDCSTLFSEPNSESLSFEIENAESTISTWISVDSSTGTLSGTVPNTAGTYTQSLEIHAYDPKRFKAVIKIEITVLPNTPPIFQGVPFTSLDFYEGILYDIDFGQYVVDDANDTISFNDTYSDPPIPGMSIDATTGVFSLTPDFANTPNTYTLHVVARDNHTAAADGNATYDVTINFLFNREPVRNKDVVDFSTFEGGDVNITLDDDTYSDPEGEDITYSYTSNDTSIYSWLTLDNATRDFSGTSPSLGINVTYLITLNANDHNPNSAEVGQTFLISIMSNKIPELDQGLPTPENPSVYHPFNYQVPSDAFKDSDGDSFTIRIELLPNEFSVSYDSASGNINGILNDNTKHGDYKIRFYVEDTYNFSSFIHDMPFTYLENFPPQIITPAVNPP